MGRPRAESGERLGARAPSAPANTFVREGEYWTVVYDGKGVRMRDVKGMHAIATLLRHPGRDFHVADLAPIGDSVREVGVLGDAGEILDPVARTQYRARLQSLGEDLAEAKRMNDAGRIESVQKEIDFLSGELSAAFGIGGRAKKGADATERIRKAVTNRIRDTLKRIDKELPELGNHFSNSIRTGTLCSYAPEKSVAWRL